MRHALARAKMMLASGETDDLRYAALELRRCLEAIVYEKLWAYRDRIPVSVARTWQPPQAFRALLVMEPKAHRTKVIRFARQDQQGVPASRPFQYLGTDSRFTPQWLTKEYNKLGAYVHAAWPFAKHTSTNDASRTSQWMNALAGVLDPLVANSFTSTFAEVVSFTCSECGTTIKANAAGLRQTKRVTCLKPGCECDYDVVDADGEFTFILDESTANCPDCGTEIRLPTNRVEKDYRFICAGCKTQYKVSESVWQFEKADE